MNDPIAVLRELVALKRMHDAIEAAEVDGATNFVDSKPLPFVKDDYARRKGPAWEAAFKLADGA